MISGGSSTISKGQWGCLVEYLGSIERFRASYAKPLKAHEAPTTHQEDGSTIM